MLRNKKNVKIKEVIIRPMVGWIGREPFMKKNKKALYGLPGAAFTKLTMIYRGTQYYYVKPPTFIKLICAMIFWLYLGIAFFLNQFKEH